MCILHCSNFYISRQENFWLVEEFVRKPLEFEDEPENTWRIHDLQDIYSKIEEGNAISISHGGIIAHWAVCIDKEDGQVVVLHREPGTAGDVTMTSNFSWFSWSKRLKERLLQNFSASKGCVKRNKLSEIVKESSLVEMTIYKCDSDININLCRAAALHKALLLDNDLYYNALTKNCEHFTFNCCSSSYLFSSIQMFEFGYLTVAAFVPVTLFLVLCLIFQTAMFKSFLLASFTHLIINSNIWINGVWHIIYAVSRHKVKAQLDCLSKNYRIEYTDIYNKATSVLYANYSPIKIDQDLTEKQLVDEEQNNLKQIYCMAQPLNFFLTRTNDPNRSYLLKSVGNLIFVYLVLKLAHATLLFNDILDNSNSIRSYSHVLRQLEIIPADIKFCALVIKGNENNEAEELLDNLAQQTIAFLVTIFDQEITECRDLLAQDNLYAAKRICKRIRSLSIPFSAIKQECFGYLEAYFDSLLNWRFYRSLLDAPHKSLTQNEMLKTMRHEFQLAQRFAIITFDGLRYKEFQKSKNTNVKRYCCILKRFDLYLANLKSCVNQIEEAGVNEDGVNNVLEDVRRWYGNVLDAIANLHLVQAKRWLEVFRARWNYLSD